MNRSSSPENKTALSEQGVLVWSKPVRILGWSLLTLILGVGFLGYFMPSVHLNWETIAAMCGF